MLGFEFISKAGWDESKNKYVITVHSSAICEREPKFDQLPLKE